MFFLKSISKYFIIVHKKSSFFKNREKIHLFGLLDSIRPAAAHSYDWSRWWRCFHQPERWPSWAGPPHGPYPSPVIINASETLRTVKIKSPFEMFSLTAVIFPLRGSITRTFLSLHAVQMRLPLRLQQTLKITSGCMSSRLIRASPVPTFQTMMRLSHPDGGEKTIFFFYHSVTGFWSSRW